MANIWTEENKYRAWLEVEILADEAWAELGEIPKEDVALIREKADFDIDRILEIEQQTRHDVVAFTRAVSETLGEERKWVHYGLTSTDVVDTAYGYLYKQANDIIRKDLENFLNIIADKAKEHKFTIMMGRTHGVHAEPTTFGLKLATWYSEMKRNIERFEHAAAGVEAGKISGAVGNFANIPPFMEEYVCDKLGIRAQEISTQVLPRDLHAEYFAIRRNINKYHHFLYAKLKKLKANHRRKQHSKKCKSKISAKGGMLKNIRYYRKIKYPDKVTKPKRLVFVRIFLFRSTGSKITYFYSSLSYSLYSDIRLFEFLFQFPSLGFFLHIFPLIVKLFTTAESHVQLHKTSFKIKGKGH